MKLLTLPALTLLAVVAMPSMALAQLYLFGVGIAASVTAATQIKVEFLDTYKARPPWPTVEKNDIAVLVSFVYRVE